MNLEILKSIKTLKKKNEKKKQKSRKRRAKNDIDINYFRKKFMSRSKLFKIDLNTFKKIVVYVVSLSSSITFSIIDEIINQFVAWVIEFTRVTKDNIVYQKLFNVAKILITRKTILKTIQEKKEIEHMNWWQRLEIEFIIDNLLIKKAKKSQRYVKSETKKTDESIETITKDVDDEFFFLYIFFWTSFWRR